PTCRAASPQASVSSGTLAPGATTCISRMISEGPPKGKQPVQPERAPAIVLANARHQAAEHQEAQIRRVAEALGRGVEEVASRLEEVVDRVEIRITRGLSGCRYLRD